MVSAIQRVDAVVRLQAGMQHLELCPGQKFKVCFPKTLKYALSRIHRSMVASQHVHPTTYTSINLDHPQVHESFAFLHLAWFILLICPTS